MKKVFSIIVIITLLLSLCSCEQAATEPEPTSPKERLCELIRTNGINDMGTYKVYSGTDNNTYVVSCSEDDVIIFAKYSDSGTTVMQFYEGSDTQQVILKDQWGDISQCTIYTKSFNSDDPKIYAFNSTAADLDDWEIRNAFEKYMVASANALLGGIDVVLLGMGMSLSDLGFVSYN